MPAVLGVLEDAGLDSEDVAETLHGAGTLLVADDGAVIGCVAVEAHGTQRLLRSLAVTPPRQRDGLGAELVDAAILAAGGADLFLLTEGAAGYFARFGFRPVPHSTVTGPVTDSKQWNGPCSTSATAMRLM